MSYISCHVETTGINFDTTETTINDGHSIVSIGLVSCDEDFNIVEENIIYNKDVDTSTSERFHGISNKFLSKFGVTEDKFAYEVAEFLDNNVDLMKPVRFIGHNIATFAVPFIRDLFQRHELSIQISTNTIDTYSILMGSIGDYNLPDVVEVFSTDEINEKYKRKELSALRKAHIFVNICQVMRQSYSESYDE